MQPSTSIDYDDWVIPRRFQDDEGFIGRTFAAHIRESGREEVICRLATEGWIQRQKRRGRSVERERDAVFDSSEVLFGKRNLLYRLKMPDGALWMARLFNAFHDKSAITDLDSRHAHRILLLESEVATMQFVRQHTQIPVPEVYGYDLTYTNSLKTPYILMEYKAGQTYPFPFSATRHVKDEDLLKIHLQLTHFAWQLAQHPFDQIGQLRPAPDGSEPVIGPIVDRKDRVTGPFADSKAFYRARAHATLELERSRHPPGSEAGVPIAIDSAELHVAAAERVGHRAFQNGPFFLQHADMHWHNLLFDEQCTVTGVVDWEWAQTVPLDSFNLLPWNFAAKMLPLDQDNVRRHHDRAVQYFASLVHEGGTGMGPKLMQELLDFQGSRQHQMVKYLEAYDFPEVRAKHFEDLTKLVKELDSAS